MTEPNRQRRSAHNTDSFTDSRVHLDALVQSAGRRSPQLQTRHLAEVPGKSGAGRVPKTRRLERSGTVLLADTVATARQAGAAGAAGWDRALRALHRGMDRLEQGLQGLTDRLAEGGHDLVKTILAWPGRVLAAWFRPAAPVRRRQAVGSPNAVVSPAVPAASRRGPGFVRLYQMGIRFLTVRHQPLLDPDFLQLPDADALVMARAMLDIQGCAGMAIDLPNPVSGRFSGRSVSQVMALVDRQELMAFLTYVESDPAPFVRRQFRLAEAYAGWVQKGGPNSA